VKIYVIRRDRLAYTVEEMRAILSRFKNACDVVGLAIIRGSSQYDAAWLPAAILKEPTFLAYSITKTLIAVLILQLTEEGLIAIDDPLVAWFPDIPQSREISLRQLLNHTAGVPDYGQLSQYHEAIRTSPSTPWNFERLAAETFNKGLWFTPGNGWAYSNPGYMLLRNIAETLLGSPLERWCRTESRARLNCGQCLYLNP
jgi:D-alanyl-D-alanine carboxypeptidase